MNAFGRLAAGLAMGIGCAGIARAADVTWQGGGITDNWSVSNNWVGLVVPSAGDVLYFDGSTGLANLNDLAAGTLFNGLTFVPSASGFAITGNAIGLAGGITNRSFNTQTVALNLALPGMAGADLQTSDLALDGALSGAGGFVKTGPGTLALSGANSHSGGVAIADGGGTVVARINATQTALGSGPVSIGAGAMLTITNIQTANVPVTNANAITGNGLLQLMFTAGTTARNSYLAGLGGFSGTIQLSNAGLTGDKWNANNVGAIDAPLVIDNGCQIFVASGVNAFRGIWAVGTGNSENRGAIRLTATLGGDVTLGGDTTVGGEGGTITGGISNGAPGLATLLFAGAGNGIATVLGPIRDGAGGPLAVVQNRAGGTLTLSGTNTHSGGITISAGTLSVGADVNLGAAANPLTFNGGTLRITGTSFTNLGARTLTALTAVALNVADASNTFFVGQGLNHAAGGLTKSGPGTLVLGGACTYPGATLISGGTLRIDAAAGSLGVTPLSFAVAGGVFEYDNTTATGARSMSLDVLTATVESTVRATRTAPQDVALTFSSLAARSMGGAVNFAVTGGVNGTEVAINLTGQPAGFINQGSFFNGADYAFMNGPGAHVRAPIYGTDADFAAENTFADGSHASVTATQPAQDSVSLQTLRLAGPGVDFSLNGAQTLTLAQGGLLKGGGGASAIRGGSGIAPGAGVEVVIRTDTAEDRLEIGTAILDQGGNAVTKSGAGTLVLSGTNTWSGPTMIQNGAFIVGGAGLLGSGAYAGRITNIASFVYAGSVSQTLSGAIAGSGALTVDGPGTLTLTASNTFTGGTTVSNGCLRAGNNNAFGPNGSTVRVYDGGGIDFVGQYQLTVNVEIVGSGPDGRGAIVNRGTGTYPGYQAVKLLGDASVGGPRRWDLRNGTQRLDLNGHILTVNNGPTGEMAFVAGAAGVVTNGGIDIATGAFAVQNNGGADAFKGAGWIDIREAGSLLFDYKAAVISAGWSITNHGGTLLGGGAAGANAGIFTIRGGVELVGSATCSVLNAVSCYMTGPIGGPGGLIKAGAGTLVLSAFNTYTGPTRVTAGTLLLTDTVSIASSPLVTVNTGATLNAMSLPGSRLTLAGGQALALDGTLAGSLTIASNATLRGSGSAMNLTWERGGIFQAGTTNLSVLGALVLSGTGARYVVSLPAGFDPAAPASWVLAQAGGGISGFDAGQFDVVGAGAGTATVNTNASSQLIVTYEPPSEVVLQMMGLALAGPSNRVTVASSGDAEVVLEAASGLAAADWQPVSTQAVVTGNTILVDPSPTNTPRFYRAKVK